MGVPISRGCSIGKRSISLAWGRARCVAGSRLLSPDAGLCLFLLLSIRIVDLHRPILLQHVTDGLLLVVARLLGVGDANDLEMVEINILSRGGLGGIRSRLGDSRREAVPVVHGQSLILDRQPIR